MNFNSLVVKPLKTGTFFDSFNPIIKIITFLLFTIVVFLANNWSSYLVVIFFSVIFLTIIDLELKNYWKAFKPVFIFLPITLFINFFVIEGDKVLFLIGSQEIYYASLIITLQIFLKLYLLFLLSMVLILSLTEVQLANSIDFLLRPLRIFKIPTHEIALMISIALRYIPILLYESKVILHAQRSRGVDFYSGKLLEKIKALLNLFNPLFVSSFMKAEELSLAMKSRGYKINCKRTRYERYPISFFDFSFLLAFILLLVSVIFLNWAF